MDELFDSLTKLGPRWMAFIIIGTIGGAIAYLIAHRQYLRQLRSGHAEQIALKDETIKMLNEARTTATSTLEQAKIDAVKERDQYRSALHEEKAHHQSTLLRLTELESRPDLGRILELERSFHEEKMKVQAKMLETLLKLEDKIDEEHQQNAKVCKEMAQTMQGLVKYLAKKGVIPNDHSLV